MLLYLFFAISFFFHVDSAHTLYFPIYKPSLSLVANKMNQYNHAVLKNIKRIFSQHPANWFSDNFVEVEKNKLYRSKTLEKEALERYITTHCIKSVLILRDAEPESQWYKDELEVAKKHNVIVHNIPLSKRRLPSNEEIAQILKLFDTAPLPMLIHCQAGADRTGMVAALWVLHKMEGTLQQAQAHLTQRRAHVQWFKPSMKQFIDIWHSLKHTPDPLKRYDHTKHPHLLSIEERVEIIASSLLRIFNFRLIKSLLKR